VRLLAVGYSTEGTFEHFCEFLAGTDADYDVLDLASVRESTDLVITESPRELVVSIDDHVYTFTEYTAFYLRAYWFETGAVNKNRALSALLAAVSAWIEHTDAVVANRPSAGNSNINKFFHGNLVASAGFSIPEAHILGDPALARTIVTGDSTWINKSCSSIKTRAVAVDDLLYARLDRLSVCPSLFQRRVRGPDVRIHVVGCEELYPEKIVAHQIDYRYRDPTVPKAQFTHDLVVPADVEKACKEYCRRERLMFAGIDFKISEEDGKWWVLEANPMPGYEPYDRRQDRRISRALLRMLLGTRTGDLDPYVQSSRRPNPSPFA